jgi:hypothetical protein
VRAGKETADLDRSVAEWRDLRFLFLLSRRLESP